MKIRVLGCSGSEVPKHRSPSFLLDGKIVFETGSITDVLSIKDHQPERIYITHLKPQYLNPIKRELKRLRMNNLRLSEDGETITV